MEGISGVRGTYFELFVDVGEREPDNPRVIDRVVKVHHKGLARRNIEKAIDLK